MTAITTSNSISVTPRRPMLGLLSQSYRIRQNAREAPEGSHSGECECGYVFLAASGFSNRRFSLQNTTATAREPTAASVIHNHRRERDGAVIPTGSGSPNAVK